MLVRRHQAGKLAETVSLYASGGDFHDIRWEAESLTQSRHFQPRNSALRAQHPHVLIIQGGEDPNEFAASSLYKCVKVCGCGDSGPDDENAIELETLQNK